MDETLLEELENARGYLEDWAKGGTPAISACGICSNLPMYSDAFDDWMKVQFLLWPEGTGCKSYPVPAPMYMGRGLTQQDRASDWYDRSSADGSQWEGEYGASRRRLCQFLVNRIDEELESRSIC